VHGQEKKKVVGANIEEIKSGVQALLGGSSHSTGHAQASHTQTKGGLLHPHSDKEVTDIVGGSGDKLVVVKFGAEWCPPCRNLAPLLD
jgi:thiol-disulfide isomerase/thioredoxin